MEKFLPIKCHIPSLKLAVELLPDTITLEEHLFYLEQLVFSISSNLMNNFEMSPWLMRLTNIASSVSMVGWFTLGSSPKVILSYSMININIPWGQVSLNLCGLDCLL